MNEPGFPSPAEGKKNPRTEAFEHDVKELKESIQGILPGCSSKDEVTEKVKALFPAHRQFMGPLVIFDERGGEKYIAVQVQTLDGNGEPTDIEIISRTEEDRAAA